ncbi:MAG: bifunctional adenosylcobinamide kinase/adenosylcobinamide-phosphate guanylyltransferase [Bacillota bacterium]|nr:bifunctional adenosylcobinamide kinase/adenosylcobinamide-phosphate guanylyltransferase [Bacillota bacterium]
MTENIILITGGVRSGKSLFAEELVKKAGREVVYIATAQSKDKEMEQRIRLHQERRPTSWLTIEEPLDIPARLKELTDNQVVLIDCLTVYLTNHLLKLLPDPDAVVDLPKVEAEMIAIIDNLVSACQECKSKIMVVSNEVGLGLVPPYLLGRVFRDMSGLANQKFGLVADQVFFVAAGIPIELKSIAYFNKEKEGINEFKANLL